MSVMNKVNHEDKVKTQRILEMDKVIRSGCYPNAVKLGEMFEVSRSTIMRDLDFLRDRYQAPLEYDFYRKGFYYSNPTFAIQSVLLTEGELFTVSAITPLLEQYKNTPLEESFKNILGKITSILPDEVSVDSSFVNNQIHFISDPLPVIDTKVFSEIFKAIQIKKIVEFGYRSIERQEYVQRTFDPYKVVCQKGNWYVIGFCHKRNDYRIFALSRIKDIKITDESFEIQKGFDVKKHFDLSYGVWKSDAKPQKIELEFSKDVNTYVLERKWHESQTVKENKDGTVYLSFKSNQLLQAMYWIMEFGASVKVLNPPELVDMVKAEIDKMKKLYK